MTGITEYSANNAWNYNTNGNLNNNNKNNQLRARATLEFQNEDNDVCLEDVFYGYYDCRKNKRNTANALQFEIDYEKYCIELWVLINNRTYQTTSSIAFIVQKPKLREIFAANFRDRVLHHLLDMKLRPILEKTFIDKTFNNRVGKGTLNGVLTLRDDIAEASAIDPVNCHIARFDIRGFFMHILKSLLVEGITSFIEANYVGNDKELIIWLIGIILYDNPEKHCLIKSPWSDWSKIDHEKSLFFILDDLGLPIGNLISQLMANFFLNEFDHYVSCELGYRYYGRYVDDFYVVTLNKAKLLSDVPLFRAKLKSIGLDLHSVKFYLQHHTKGVEFIGSVIKRGKIYPHRRTVNNAFLALHKLNALADKGTNAEHFVATVNSYLGLFIHCNAYRLRKRFIGAIAQDWEQYITIQEDFTKVNVKPKYTIRNQIKRRLQRERRKHNKERRMYDNTRTNQCKGSERYRSARLLAENRLSIH